MKSLARSYFWWVKIDEDIKKIVKTCESCQKHQSMPASALVHPWECTRNPWVRLHMDYLGPVMGKIFLVIVYSYSKWVEVFQVSNSTSQTNINCLRTCFATHGLPQIYVSDNGSCFTRTFYEKEQHCTYQICLYHPATNGCAERLARTFKNTFRKMEG